MTINLQSVSINKVQEFFPSLDFYEIHQNLEYLKSSIDQLSKLASKLKIPLDKVQEAASNIFAHYPYHKRNCWTVYRSLVAKRAVTHNAKIKNQEDWGLSLQKKVFFDLALQKKLQDLGELLTLASQEKFLEYFSKSSLGSNLILSFNLGSRQLMIESLYVKEQEFDKFCYDYRFTS